MSGMLDNGTAGALVAEVAGRSLVTAAVGVVAVSGAVAGAVSLPPVAVAGAGDGLGMPVSTAAGGLVADSVAGTWFVPTASVWDKADCRRTSPPSRTAISSFFITFVCFNSVSSNLLIYV